MNKKITADELHDAIARQLSGLEPDPRLARRIIAAEKEEVKMKKVSHTAVIIAAVMLLAMATALAAGLGGRVNWLGEVQHPSEAPIHTSPMPTVVPLTGADPNQIDPTLRALLEQASDRELIAISTARRSIWSNRIQRIAAREEFDALMDASPDFPLPVRIPEGYVFEKGYVQYGCLPRGEYILSSQTVHPEGFTVSRYSVDRDMDLVTAYDLTFRTEDEKDRLFIHAFMAASGDPHQYEFIITEGQTARAVQVKGMDNALIIDSGDTGFVTRDLVMRKKMSAPQESLQFTGTGTTPVTETYEEYQIDIGATGLSESELTAIFAK